MSDDEKPQKINIGFLGGQVLAARVSKDEFTKLRASLVSQETRARQSPEGWHELTAEDGTVAVDLSKVVYVLIDTEGHHVGFGG